MMRRWLPAAMLVLAGCASNTGAGEAPATVVEQSARGRAELTQIIRGALGDPALLLGQDLLVIASSVSIERLQRRDARGLPLDGRDLGRPEQFELVKAGRRCVLVRSRTAQRWILKQVKCRASGNALQ
jgi:hypothetical protein